MARDIAGGWSVETLNKAYRQGYLAASLAMGLGSCPYRSDVVVAAWEAGWEDATQVAQDAASANVLFAGLA